jgi:hypothetical protein
MPGKIAKTDVSVADYEIHDITPNMIDWWWVNMDKGYMLWSPDHKKFEWEVPPTDTPVGAIQCHEQGPGLLRKMRTRYEDPNSLPPEIKGSIIFEHVLVLGGLSPENKIHFYGVCQYEAASYGTRYRTTGHPQANMPPLPNEVPKHIDGEMARWPQFLPELYKMWQFIKDPTINRQCCCKVVKEGSTIKYIRR